MKLPEMIDLNKFPLCTATAIAIKNPMVARSPNGKIIFPGTITAIKIVNGINNKPTVTTWGSPNKTAGSKPI